MKTETLEFLLIDRAMRELPPATAELLDEYLAQNPAAARSAEPVFATLELARQAVAVPREMPSRPLALAELRPAPARPR